MKKIDLKNQYKSGLNYTKSYVTLNEENANDFLEFTIYGNRLANYLVKTYERYNIYLANKSLLEIGCGMGRLMKPLSTHFYWVSGVDISKEILQEASIYLENTPNISLYENDGKSLNLFENETFDCILTTGVLQHIPKREIIENYFKEAIRVLKMEGFFLFSFQIWQTDIIGHNRVGAKISAKWLNQVFKDQPVKLLEVAIDSKDHIPHMCILIQKIKESNGFVITPEIVQEIPWRTLCWEGLKTCEQQINKSVRRITFFDNE